VTTLPACSAHALIPAPPLLSVVAQLGMMLQDGRRREEVRLALRDQFHAPLADRLLGELWLQRLGRALDFFDLVLEVHEDHARRERVFRLIPSGHRP
jgi:hypothetical protein